MRAAKSLTILSVLVLTLAACSADDGGSTTTETAGEPAATTSPDSNTTAPAPAETTTSSGDEETTTSQEQAQGSVDAGCVLGSWEMDSEGFVAQIQDVFGQEMDDATAEFAGGSYVVTFGDDGSFTGIRDDWSWKIGTSEGTLVQTINSEEAGTYSIDSGELEADVETITFDVKSQIEVDGQLIDLPSPPGGINLDDDDFDPHGSVNCDGDTMTVTADEDLELVFNRA